MKWAPPFCFVYSAAGGGGAAGAAGAACACAFARAALRISSRLLFLSSISSTFVGEGMACAARGDAKKGTASSAAESTPLRVWHAHGAAPQDPHVPEGVLTAWQRTALRLLRLFLVVRVGKKRGHARQEARIEFISRILSINILFFLAKNADGAKEKNNKPPFPPKLAPARGDDWHGENVGDELHLLFR